MTLKKNIFIILTLSGTWYVKRSSSGDINPASYHLTAFELMNQLLYINFLSLERNFFLKDLKYTMPLSVAL